MKFTTHTLLFIAVAAALAGLAITIFAAGPGEVFVPVRTKDGRAVMRKVPVTVTYWTDPNTYVSLYEMETTNTTQSLDTSGNGLSISNRPSVATGPAWTVVGSNQYGRIEHCYTLDGADDYFLLAYTETNWWFWSGTNDKPFTIGAWVTIDNLTNGLTMRIMQGASSWSLAYGEGVLSFNLKDSARGGYEWCRDATASNTLPAQTWIFIVATYDGRGGDNAARNGMNIYTNGAIKASPTRSGSGTYWAMTNTAGTDMANVGAYRSTSWWWDGQLDNVFVLNYAIDATNTVGITNLYRYTHPTNNIRARP